MKTYSLSKQDVEYLQPLDSVLNGMNVAIQVYVVNSVFKRLGLPQDSKARYDIGKGELYLLEEKDLQPVKPEPTVDAEKKPEEAKN